MQTKQSPPEPSSSLILNVDDREAMRYARERVLTTHGFQVTSAGTGQEALRLARKQPPALILMDVHLPDADGRDLCQQLKADARLSRVPVVLISSTLGSDADVLEMVKWAGADAFVREPVEPETLISTLRRVLIA